MADTTGTATAETVPHKDADGVDMRWWMAETYRAYAAVAVDGGQHALARDLLLRSLRLRPLSGPSWRTAAYLFRRALGRTVRANAA